MKILLVTGNYLPGKNGGIENYTHWLATLLLQHHFEVEVASLNLGEIDNYIYERVKLHNLKSSFSTFETLLKNGTFDICHFHEYSEYGGIEIPWFKKAKEYCNKVFFTFHLPYLTCYKNDFRYKGLEDCNTFNDSARCAKCIITEKMNRAIGTKFSTLGAGVLMHVPRVKNRFENKVALKYHYLEDLIATCDQVFVIADWFKKILFDNGYINSNIHKIPNKPAGDIAENSITDNSTLKNKILFIGRIQYQKGLHLLCGAMNLIHSKNLELDVYGNKVDEGYFDKCLQEYAFKYKGSVTRDNLMAQIKTYDFLVLPSVFTEMYPLVILDALHRHLPVIASTAKGNKDVIINGVNGFLFEYDDAGDLAKTIDKTYRLKTEGWKPEFKYPENPDKDIEEIISYYSLAKMHSAAEA
ncbi:MAG: glycosyltransferase [Bacteroidota bacterium]|nr:glycosyltransferase [Bacteroidota bacterium]